MDKIQSQPQCALFECSVALGNFVTLLLSKLLASMLNACKAKCAFQHNSSWERHRKKAQKLIFPFVESLNDYFPPKFGIDQKSTPGLKTLTFSFQTELNVQMLQVSAGKDTVKVRVRDLCSPVLSLYSLNSHLWNNPESTWQEHSIHVWVQRAHLTSQALIKT